MSQAIHKYELCGKSLNQNDQLQVHLGTQQETSHTSASTVGRVSIRIACYRCTSGYIRDKNVVTMDIVEVSRRFFLSFLLSSRQHGHVETLYQTQMWVGIYIQYQHNYKPLILPHELDFYCLKLLIEHVPSH